MKHLTILWGDKQAKQILDQNIAVQGISADVAQAQKDDLERQLAPKAEVVVRNQEEKRRELDKSMEAMVRDSQASITKEVTHVARRPAWLVVVWSLSTPAVEPAQTIPTTDPSPIDYVPDYQLETRPPALEHNPSFETDSLSTVECRTNLWLLLSNHSFGSPSFEPGVL